MKIERFKQINEKLTPEIEEFITNFDGSCDEGAIDWIMYISTETKVPEYQNVYNKNFQESKKLKVAQKFLDAENERNRLCSELEKIENKIEKLKLEAASEVLYKFQEDLLKNDPDNFFKLFLEDGEYTGEGYGESHPDIIKKYQKELDILLSAKKYNL